MQQNLIACHECDLLHRITPLPVGGAARCVRCGSVLYREKRDSLNRTLALSITGLVLFIVANTFPFLAFKLEGLVQETILTTGAWHLYEQGEWEVALLVLLTSVAFPLVELLGMLYLLLPLKMGRSPRHAARVMRLLHGIEPWAMMEVFMLGILGSIVKLAKMATIVPGTAAWAFAALILVMAGISATFEPRIVWQGLGNPR